MQKEKIEIAFISFLGFVGVVIDAKVFNVRFYQDVFQIKGNAFLATLAIAAAIYFGGKYLLDIIAEAMQDRQKYSAIMIVAFIIVGIYALYSIAINNYVIERDRAQKTAHILAEIKLDSTAYKIALANLQDIQHLNEEMKKRGRLARYFTKMREARQVVLQEKNALAEEYNRLRAEKLKELNAGIANNGMGWFLQRFPGVLSGMVGPLFILLAHYLKVKYDLIRPKSEADIIDQFIRGEIAMTQKELAGQLGYSEATFSRIVNRRRENMKHSEIV